MKENELKIFLTFLVLFSLFAQWNDAWDYSFYFLPARSLSERSSLNVDPYVNVTYEHAKFGSHYYSHKYIGHSILAASLYEGSKIPYSFFPSELLPKRKMLEYKKNDLPRMYYEKAPLLSFSRAFITIFLV
ncbi:MAG: hypothetical protein ABEK36_03470, partial [Candidatus Aenigmatarchaeota archaeon]